MSSVFGLNTARFDEVVEKIEAFLLAYRNHMEALFLKHRCNETTFLECQAANYDAFLSALPNPTCPGGLDFQIPACGMGEECSGYYDFTKSVYSLAPGVDEKDPTVIEAVCIARLMDGFLIEQNKKDRAFWDDLGSQPRAMYFGSTTGAFQYYPGRPTKDGEYDHRPRPWNVAATSGPKNLILVLDKSGSMETNARMSLLKDAAKKVIETLTIGDRVAIVVFDETVRIIGDEGMYLYKATHENKAILTEAIDKLEGKGATNIFDALGKAFDVLDNSIENEYAVPCNSAILFLTDGEMTHPKGVTPENVTDLVARRVNATSTRIGKPLLFFSYSVSEQEEVHTLPKELACITPFGVWNRINSNENIVEALANYYSLFALGLGVEENADFVAWVEPYNFTTGGIGVTASIPVYGRTKSPYLLEGVVSIDFDLEALNRALGTDDSTEAIAQLARRSVAVCPTMILSECEKDSYRAATGGNEARCRADICSADDLIETVATQCLDSSKHPDNLRANTDMDGVSYENKTCCVSDNASDTGVCVGSDLYVEGKDGLSTGAIAGIAVGGGVVFLCLVFCLLFVRHRARGRLPLRYPPPRPSAPDIKEL